MPTIPHIENIDYALDSVNTPTADSRRRRINGRLYGIGDTVYIVPLRYNGTILDFRGQRILVIPHDYGYPDLFSPTNLRFGSGINCHQRLRLDQLGYYYHDPVLLTTGTHPAPHRRYQRIIPPFNWTGYSQAIADLIRRQLHSSTNRHHRERQPSASQDDPSHE